MIPLSIQDPITPALQAPTGFRRFVLRWNSRKTLNNPRCEEWQEAQGVVFSAHDALARVALSNGMTFAMMAELEFALNQGGDYRVEWIDQEYVA